MARGNPVVMPSEVSPRVGLFDRFAGHASLIASRATFFAFCVLLVVLWLPSYFLLQNSQTRADQAVQHKLNAIADALADLMEQSAKEPAARALTRDLVELRTAVGLETHESTSHNEAANA